MRSLLAVILLTSVVRAHGGLPISQDIHRQADGPTMYVPVVFWGLWIGGPPWTWICEEIINDFRGRKFAVASDGTFYATATRGLSISSNRGCSWSQQTNTPLGELSATDVTVDPADALTVYVTTASGTVTRDAGTATDGVFVSHDHGATFTALPLPERNYLSVRTSADGLAIYTTSRGPTSDLLLHRSVDRGVSFSEHALLIQLDGKSPYSADVLTVDPRNANALYLRLFYEGKQALARSLDGGQTIETLLVQDAAPQQIAIADFAIDTIHSQFWAATAQGVFRANDAPQTTPSFAKVPGLSQAQCVNIHNGDVYACSSAYAPDFSAIARYDGTNWVSLLQYVDTVGPAECPAGTPGATECPYYWYTYGEQLGIDFDMGRGDMGEPPSSCNCRIGAATAPSPWLLIVGILWLWRRFRLRWGDGDLGSSDAGRAVRLGHRAGAGQEVHR